MTTLYQRGLDMLLKVDTAASGGPTYTTLGGIRSASMSIDSQAVDVTNADSAGQWRELLDNAGTKDIKVSGSGVGKKETVAAKVLDYSIGSVIRSWEVIVPGLGTFALPMKITSFKLDGKNNGEVAFSISLASAGAPVFTAEA